MQDNIENLKKAVAKLPHSLDASLRMEDLLDSAIAALPELLQDKAAWQSLYIDYEPPFLMRLYIPVCSGQKTLYLSLHYFFGKDGTDGLNNPYARAKDAFNKESVNNYHPHPWASAFHLFEGSYKQQLGLAKELGYSDDPASPLRPKPFETREQNATDGTSNRYSFNDPLMWHRVLPNGGTPISTLMLTYKPEGWNQCGPKPATKQRPLTEQEREFMFKHFQDIVAPQAKPAADKNAQKKFKLG